MTSRYETLTGRQVDTSGLSARERAALARLHEEYATGPRSDAFAAAWTRVVFPLLSRVAPESRPEHPLYVVAQDLELKLGIAQGTVAPPDYRDYLADRIEERYGSRYRFCQATGIPQAFLSQVLSGSKDFSVDTLRRAAHALDLSLALLPTKDLAGGSDGEVTTLTRTCQTLQDELAVLEDAHARVKRFRKVARRRAALERASFAGVLARVAAPLKDLDDERFGVRIVTALEAEIERIEGLLAGLREQLARVVEAGPIAPRGGGRQEERAPLPRV